VFSCPRCFGSRALPDITALTLWTHTLVNVGPYSAPFNPLFDLRSASVYSITVPYIMSTASIRATFNFSGSVLTSLNLAGNFTTIVSNVLGPKYPLSVGPAGTNVLWVQSTRDGNATITVRRLDPDMQNIFAWGLPAIGSGIAPMLLDVTPTFNTSRGPSTYRVTVTYQFGQFSMTPVFGVPNTTTVDNGLTATGFNVDSGSPSNIFNLYVGNNTFHACSSVDGNYTYIITRLQSDIQHTTSGLGIVVAPVNVNGPSPPIVMSLPVNGSNYFYTTTVPFVTIGVTVAVRLRTPGSVALDLDFANRTLAVINVTSQVYLLAASQTQSLHVNSSLDGYYTFNITRLPPDLTALNLTGYSWTLQETYLNPLLNNAFVPGVTKGYNLTVPSIVRSVRIFGVFSVVNSITAYVQQQDFVFRSGAFVVSNISRVVDPPSLIALSTLSLSYQLTNGRNTLILNSTQDGVYTIVITRLNPDVQQLYPLGYGDSGTVTSYNLSYARPPESLAGLSPPFIAGAQLVGNPPVVSNKTCMH
jgi:hypothetical protein